MKKKFNGFDYFVFVMIGLLILGGGYYIYRQGQGPSEKQTPSESKAWTFVVEAENVLEEVAASVQVGDQLVAMNKYQAAYIEAVEVIPDYSYEMIDDQLEKREKESRYRLRVTIQGDVNQYGPYVDLGGQELKVGLDYWIKTDHMHALGRIVDVISKEAN